MSSGFFFEVIKMARARNIKPAFFQNENLADLKPIERLAFIGLWTIADFKGCLEYRSKRLKVQLLPYDNCDIDLIMESLEKSGFIRIYSVNEHTYIKVVNFEKHQNPHKNEREAGSDIPDFIENDYKINDMDKDGIKTDNIGTARADSLNLIPETLKPMRSEIMDDFDIFYQSYPKKVGKDKAKESWKKKRPPLDIVLQALQWQIQSEDWKKESGKYIPHPATYLNQGRWQDEPPVVDMNPF